MDNENEQYLLDMDVRGVLHDAYDRYVNEAIERGHLIQDFNTFYNRLVLAALCEYEDRLEEIDNTPLLPLAYDLLSRFMYSQLNTFSKAKKAELAKVIATQVMESNVCKRLKERT